MSMKKAFLLACACALSLCCSSPFAAAPAQTPAPPAPPVHSLKVTILSTMLADEGIGEWGFAALVEADGHKILFDTGARPNTVLENARLLEEEPSLVHLGLRDNASAAHTDAVLLRGELGRGRGPSHRRSHVGLSGRRQLRRRGLCGGGKGQGESRADEKHFHPICEKLRSN